MRESSQDKDCTDESFTGIWFDATSRPVPDVLGPDPPYGIVRPCLQCDLDCI